MHEAKSNLSKLVSKALKGEKVVIAKSGKPLVELRPIEEKIRKRQGNQWKGKVWIAPDFDVWPEEVQKSFDGEGNEVFD